MFGWRPYFVKVSDGTETKKMTKQFCFAIALFDLRERSGLKSGERSRAVCWRSRPLYILAACILQPTVQSSLVLEGNLLRRISLFNFQHFQFEYFSVCRNRERSGKRRSGVGTKRVSVSGMAFTEIGLTRSGKTAFHAPVTSSAIYTTRNRLFVIL